MVDVPWILTRQNQTKPNIIQFLDIKMNLIQKKNQSTEIIIYYIIWLKN